jgi:hypothetical protein
LIETEKDKDYKLLFYFKYSSYLCGMVKDFIQYTEALELKQLGFDEPCFGVYATKDGYVRKSAYDEIGDAPTYSQAFRWFRCNYWYYASISPTIDIGNVDFTVEVSHFFQEDRYVGEGDEQEYFPRGLELVYTERFDTYEEAELACLKEMIKTANNNYGKQ